MKWEGILDAVNRLPVDVAERQSRVAQGTSWDESGGCMDQESRLYCIANLLRGKS